MNINSHLPINGQTVLIIGNRSYKNLGDELILLWTVKLLLQQTPTTEGGLPTMGPHIIISCYDPKRLKHFFSQFIDTKQITFIHELPKGIRSAFQRLKKGWLKELRYFRKTDTLILWGGEILTEENPSAYRYRLAWMRPFLLHVIARRRETKRRSNPKKQHTNELIIMWGVQIPTTSRRKKLLHFLLNHTTHLYLRDFQAIEEIKKFCLPRTKLRGYPNVDFFMDTSYFAYDWDTPFHKGGEGGFRKQNWESSSSEIIRHNLPKSYIIINLNKNGERFLSDLTKDVQTYLNKGYTVYFVPVAKWHNTYYNDLQYLAPLMKGGQGGSNTKIEVLDREHDFSHFIQILQNAELVISTRLHLFLIASFLWVPTKVYPYQRKILKMQEVIKKFAKKD